MHQKTKYVNLHFGVQLKTEICKSGLFLCTKDDNMWIFIVSCTKRLQYANLDFFVHQTTAMCESSLYHAPKDNNMWTFTFLETYACSCAHLAAYWKLCIWFSGIHRCGRVPLFVFMYVFVCVCMCEQQYLRVLQCIGWTAYVCVYVFATFARSNVLFLGTISV